MALIRTIVLGLIFYLPKLIPERNCAFLGKAVACLPDNQLSYFWDTIEMWSRNEVNCQ